MNLIEHQRERLRQYLLGVLPEPEQTTLENEFLNDEDSFEQMVAAENELVDGYVRNQLTAQERRQFEQHYLAHPDRRERVRFAQTLLAKIDQQSESVAEPVAEPIAARREVAGATSWWQTLLGVFRSGNWQLNWAASVALLLLAVTAGALYLRTRPNPISRDVATRETPSPITSSPSPAAFAQPSVLPSPTASEKKDSVFATLALTVGGLRGEGDGQAARLALSPNVDFVRLQLRLRRLDYPSYRVSLNPIGGAEVWRKQGIKSKVSPSGENLTVEIPANRLSPGDYLLTTRGVTKEGEIEEVGKSSFQVIRK
jgi:hypothetical protein